MQNKRKISDKYSMHKDVVEKKFCYFLVYACVFPVIQSNINLDDAVRNLVNELRSQTN